MHRIRALFRRAFTPTNGSINVNLSGNDAVCAPQKTLAFRRLVCDRLSLSSYSLLDDDFRRLSRSSKVVFTGLSAFLVVPGGFALLTTPSEVSYDLTSHQFKLSSATLSWLSATALTFYLTRYQKSILTIGVTLVGLLGSWGSLIAELYSEVGGYCGLLTSYMLFGVAVCPYRLRPLRLTGLRVFNHDPGRALGPGGSRGTPLMPACVAKPIFWTAGLNTLLLLLTAWRRYYVKEKLATSKPEDIIRRDSGEAAFYCPAPYVLDPPGCFDQVSVNGEVKNLMDISQSLVASRTNHFVTLKFDSARIGPGETLHQTPPLECRCVTIKGVILSTIQIENYYSKEWVAQM